MTRLLIEDFIGRSGCLLVGPHAAQIGRNLATGTVVVLDAGYLPRQPRFVTYFCPHVY